jgi:hypothetical protein
VSGLALPLAGLVPVATFFAAIYASSVGASLNRESSTRDISWTKPISRTLLALQFVLVDLAGVAIAFAVAVLATVIVVMRIGAIPVFDAALVPAVLLGLGVAAMWYALIQALTFWFGPAARTVGGILWPVAFVALGVASIPGIYGVLARAFDVINPLAYIDFNVNGNSRLGGGLWTLPADERALIVWLFAAVFCAIAVTMWPRKEA